VHQTCLVNFSGAEIRSWRVQSCSPLGHRTLSGGTPDSPVNYSEAPLRIPEGEEFGLESPGQGRAKGTCEPCARIGPPKIEGLKT
jgi:hypothetical protein